MKAVHILFILLLLTGASAAYIWLQSPEPPLPELEQRSEAAPAIQPPPVLEEVAEPAVMPSNAVAEAVVQERIQPIEERGDAMLFEIDALQHMPFDQSITTPFD